MRGDANESFSRPSGESRRVMDRIFIEKRVREGVHREEPPGFCIERVLSPCAGRLFKCKTRLIFGKYSGKGARNAKS